MNKEFKLSDEDIDFYYKLNEPYNKQYLLSLWGEPLLQMLQKINLQVGSNHPFQESFFYDTLVAFEYFYKTQNVEKASQNLYHIYCLLGFNMETMDVSSSLFCNITNVIYLPNNTFFLASTLRKEYEYIFSQDEGVTPGLVEIQNIFLKSLSKIN